MESGIWIRIQFNNYNQYEGSKELISELKQVCIVQDCKKWYPSACTGLELLLGLNFNLTLLEFLNNVVIPGAEFAGIVAASRKIWKAFDKFIKRNEETFELLHLELTFDDVVIKIENRPTYGYLLNLYQQLPHHMSVFKKEGIEELSEIRLPFIEIIDEETGRQKYVVAYENTLEETHLWRLKYLYGCETVFYNPSKEQFV